jgi:hypothetical protein
MANSASVRRRGSWAETAAWANLFFNLSWCDMKMNFVKAESQTRGWRGGALAFLGVGARMKGLDGRERGEGVAAFTRLRWRNQSLIE